ncbi:MAG: patatin-like phospholipase family protein [Oleispira antarctica]|nr:patatin-like phospholipase family protein [Oleispira antarctica]MBQ0792936.1 patatin-like phospholipase family protein [Oleispira antarctica]
MDLQILAGKKALAEIQQHGLRPERIKLMIGASGGPKWLMLSRLDQYLSEHFLSKATQPISLLGSSIGSWRMACYAQKNPVAIFKEFEQLYLNQRYSEKLIPSEISIYVQKVLSQLFSPERAQHIVSNPLRKLHVVAVRNRRLLNGRSRLSQGFGLLSAAAGNIFSSKIVAALYPRVIISPQKSTTPYFIKTEAIELKAENLSQSLIASGAIPMVMEPTKVTGGKNRWHWDGGLVDYHFSGPFNAEDGLVFYPHFFPKITPGWLDKGIPWRKAKADNYDNVVMLAPSASFIAKLPYGKIPDRKDFVNLSNEDREAYWNTVLEATNGLVNDLHTALEKDGARSAVMPIESIL